MNKHLLRHPHNHEKARDAKGEHWWWWYEEPSGMCIVVQFPGLPPIPSFTIPWRSIRAALRRKDQADDNG